MNKDHTYSSMIYDIKGMCIRIHKALGAGLLESAYKKALVVLLKKSGYKVIEEAGIDIKFEDVEITNAFRADLIVNDMLIIELKAVEKLEKPHFLQFGTYLQLSGIPYGLLVNFHSKDIFQGMYTASLQKLRELYH